MAVACCLWAFKFMPKKILVVDDEPEIVLLIQGRLKAAGYDVIIAHDGLTALELARRQNPDCVVLDVMMPKMDGYRVCRMLKFDQVYQHIPVILLTAKGKDEDRETGAQVGADAYISKPFDAGSLLKQIQTLIG